MAAPTQTAPERAESGLTAVSRSVAYVDVALLLGAAGLAAGAAIMARRFPRARYLLPAGLAGVGALTAAAVRLGVRSGATDAEVVVPRPGDDLVPQPRHVIDRAITIRAPAAAIWPWIVQMGYHRAGWYTNETLDRIVWHIDNPNVDQIVPELQALAVGDVVPDGPPGTAYWKIAALEPERALVFLDDEGTHVPGTVCSWAWFLDPVDAHTTRVLTRSRFGYPESPRMEALVRLLIGPADLLMTGQMMRGIQRRVARAASPTPLPAPA